mmetsp:Transcript_16071/g.38044  ORF Transcript_16071/g.38044 Transcript_16071/m.38044 type:complete len:169 (+) Transcript_16071:121-627(+)
MAHRLLVLVSVACADPLGKSIYDKFAEISESLDFGHDLDSLQSIQDWLHEDISHWAPKGELALRSHIVSLLNSEDEDDRIAALRVYHAVCQMHMLLGSDLFAPEAASMQSDAAISRVLQHLKYGSEGQETYGLADAVNEHLESAEELSSFGAKMLAAKRNMDGKRGEL